MLPIPHTPPARHGPDLFPAHHQRVGYAPETPRKRRVADVQPTGEGAEGGHDEAAAICGETSPSQRATVAADFGGGVEVAGDFASCLALCGFVTKDEAAEFDGLVDFTTELRRRGGVVIALDPDPA